jgi:hypothetical protein
MTVGAGTVVRVGSTTKAILQVVACCERAPTGVLARAIGGVGVGPTREVLARLRRAGLVQVESAKPSLRMGRHPDRLWSLTQAGAAFISARRVIASPPNEKEFPLIRANQPARRQSSNSLIVAYSVLDSFLGELKPPFCLRAWEAPFVRSFSAPDQRSTWHIRIEAAAGLDVGDDGTKITVLLLVDPGTSRVVSFRSLLLRLYALRRIFAAMTDPCQPLLVIATPEGQESERRREAWRELLRHVARQLDEEPIRTQFVSWNDRIPRATSAESNIRKRRLATRPTQMDSVLLLLARHPLLTRKQLASLLCTSPSRISRVQHQMIKRGLLRPVASPIGYDHLMCQLGLTELTFVGQREATRLLPLHRQSSFRNGLVERRPGVHRRLLRNVWHTVGVNDFFVNLAEVAREIPRKGGDDALEQWRSAAACARGSFRPDGYGCYRRGNARYGFFVEYDRGTESPYEYVSKLGTYYRYRDRGTARFEFEGFPTLLFVTTRPIAEERFALEATRIAARTPAAPLNIFLTTTVLTNAHPQGVLGDVWAGPEVLIASGAARRQYWLPPQSFTRPDESVRRSVVLGDVAHGDRCANGW